MAPLHCPQEIKGDAVIVKDIDANDGDANRLVGTVITRIPKALAANPAEWNAAWYLYENGKWVTQGTKMWKTAPVTTFDVRKLVIEDPEYALVDDNDPDISTWLTLPAPGKRNGPA